MGEEKEYPMTLEEFKKRMIELFLEREEAMNGSLNREYVLEIVEEVTQPDDDLLDGLYGQTCDNYDKGGCEAADNAFDDEWLPVRILDML